MVPLFVFFVIFVVQKKAVAECTREAIALEPAPLPAR
jgi:hypothetical protein